MRLINSAEKYGVFSIVLHWVMAIIIVGMFFLGEYMVDLGYYDAWYHIAPWWHKSVGIVVFTLLLIRWGFRVVGARLAPLASYSKWEYRIACATHWLFYCLLFIICISGFFVATAKGAGVEVFSWFDIPAIIVLSEGQVDFWGEVHEVSTLALAVLFLIHASASIKHHFVDRDATLTRMLGR